MGDFLVELYIPALAERPDLLRPVFMTVMFLGVAAKVFFYFLLPTIAVISILTGAAVLVMKHERNVTIKAGP